MPDTVNVLISNLSTVVSLVTLPIVEALTVGTKLIYLIPLLARWNSASNDYKSFLRCSRTGDSGSGIGSLDNDGMISFHNED